ncbi:anti-sigma factor [Clostridium sp. D2Q-11]|uniref:Anti-sigma factor n=1 Tax=Anaeromonas frigoriresistens TaxID=2683708 RepID=A0A942USJ1_9FIRM|nr:anti-sigma factor [Anaeromonas frigoriresistens]MBS4538424.1 anti-sigma factor [Anaeromonas frigoriresistens]
MSDDFKKKLKDYFEGKLSEEERIEIEKELEKLEIYQETLDEDLKVEEPKEEEIFDKKHRRMIKRGKWKARFHNAFTVIAIFLVVCIVSSVISSVYYTGGEPNRLDVYRDVLTYSVSVRLPNVRLINLNSEQNIFFTNDYTGKLIKRIGGDSIKVGEFEGTMLFNKMSINPLKIEDKYFINDFSHPKGEIKFYEWEKLERVPEGTVAEAYLSFDQGYETDEILQKFKGENLSLIWLAVDTGYEEDIDYYLPIGFPYLTMWHQDDYVMESREVEEGPLFSKTVLESGHYPEVEDYGSGKLRNENFIKTLKLIQEYDSVSKTIIETPIIDNHLQYIEENGVKIYGMVVTGPSKEILKLKEEDWVRGIKVGEIEFWNINEDAGF